MRKGKLEKTKNHLKNSIDYDRDSFGKSGRWVTIRAYLNAHDMVTYVGLVEGHLDLSQPSYRYSIAIKFGFNTIEDAWQWADGNMNYKDEVWRERYCFEINNGSRRCNTCGLRFKCYTEKYGIHN